MRLNEIEQPSAEQCRVNRLKDNAKAAKETAKRLTTQAKASADQLKLQQSRQQLAKSSEPTTGSTIKPHA